MSTLQNQTTPAERKLSEGQVNQTTTDYAPSAGVSIPSRPHISCVARAYAFRSAIPSWAELLDAVGEDFTISSIIRVRFCDGTVVDVDAAWLRAQVEAVRA